jgi:hypothetical protein
MRLFENSAFDLALDVKTGEVIWEYKRAMSVDLPICCGRNSRGVAVHGTTVYFGSLDADSVALNANNGKVLRQTSVASPSDGYSITGAPLVVNNSVVVGVAGGEFGVRGFLAAYDLSNGHDSSQTPVLANLGRIRTVFITSLTGEFLVGVPFVDLDWTRGVTSTGRPIPSDAANVSTGGFSRQARPSRQRLLCVFIPGSFAGAALLNEAPD